MIRLILLLLSLGFAGVLSGQKQWQLLLDTLQDYETSDVVKRDVSNQLTQQLEQQLKCNSEFSIGDEPLHKVVAPDSSLFIYTWHYTLRDASSAYGGVLLHHKDVYPLYYSTQYIEADEVYDAYRWGGGIYYEIIPHYNTSDTSYTLLTWDGNNGVSFKKIIDVLSFDRKRRPVFGKAIFAGEGRKVQRYVLEYSSEMSLLLSYDKGSEQIVTNALRSDDQRFGDVRAYYSATDDFNVFRFENGLWVLYEDVDLRMSPGESKQYKDPKMKSSGL